MQKNPGFCVNLMQYKTPDTYKPGRTNPDANGRRVGTGLFFVDTHKFCIDYRLRDSLNLDESL